ncbi:DUF3857 domain-containing protein [Flavisolibacter sp. BT320]|nr:DUF3857 domain-containing protein [Flavisolibacter longurius]
MIRKFCAFVLLILAVSPAFSQATAISFTADAIPADLKKDANAVFRLDEATLDVVSPSEYSLRVRQVVTLLDAEGAHHLRHRIGIDKFNKVDFVEISIYNAQGALVKKYGKKDFAVEAAIDGISLVNDDKVMELYTPAPGYPCTIDVQYKRKNTGYIELPNWYINFHDASTEIFRYEVNVPAALDVRHRTLNFSITPKMETVGNLKQYTWEARNIPAKKFESEGFEPARYLPQVEVAPNEFSYDGYKGSFRSWKDFGSWNYALYEEKEAFSPHRVAEIKALIADTKTREEKIRVLYQYLQKNMRYVSIQLGIGGFKPFAVNFVDNKKYGDCKALTNYMRYLLKAADIPSYPALINAGYNKIPADPAFPSDPFNHVILCIPGAKDTTWLECTSTNNKVDELGASSENKKALLLTEAGGILVNTPRSAFAKNTVFSSNSVTITAEGTATIENSIRSAGDAASFFQYVSQLTDGEQKEALVQFLLYKNPEALTVTTPAENEGALFQINRTYNKLFLFKTGNKYFYPACINKLATEKMKPFQRTMDFLFHFPYTKSDTTVFQLPANHTVETLPANKEIVTPFSTYKRSCSYDKANHRLTVISTLVLKDHVIPAASYGAMVSFFRNVNELEEETFVLQKEAQAVPVAAAF